MKRWIVVALLCMSSGCAVLGEKGRYFAKRLDAVAPQSQAGKALLVPVALPVGAVALTIDGLLVNPLLVLEDAIDDAKWAFEVESTGILEVFVTPMRIVTFVGIFLGSELLRICVPL